MTPENPFAHQRHARLCPPGRPGSTPFENPLSSWEQASRHSLLVHLFDHLRMAFGVDCPGEIPAGEKILRHDIEALLAFKTDPTLDQLQRALTRLDNGTYGLCLACKGRLSRTLLDVDPLRQLCPKCEETLIFSPSR